MKNIKLSILNIIMLFKILGKDQIFGLILRIFSTIVNIVFPFLLIYYEKKLIQLIQREVTGDTLLVTTVLTIAGILLLQNFLSVFLGFINSILNNKLSCKLEYTLHKKCINAKIFAYDNYEIYDKMNIAKRIGVSTITDYIFTFFNIISTAVQFMSSAIILGSYSVWLLLGALLGAIPMIFTGKLGFEYEIFDKSRTNIVRRMNYFKQIATEGEYTKETKIFGMLPFICDEHKRYCNEFAKIELAYRDKDHRFRLIWQPMISLFIMVLPSLFLIWRASLHEIDVADFSYYLSLLSLCHGNLTSIINYFFSNKLSDSRIKDYFDFLNLSIDSRTGNDIPSEWLDEIPEIEFRNVSFCYSGSELNAVDNVSFTIKPNEKVAILGLNGAGKTTLIKMLCGLYEASEGEILIGGRNIKEFSQVSLYQLFSVVFQDYINYELPLVESISLGGNKNSYNSIKQAFYSVDGEDLLKKRFSNDINKVIGKKLNAEGVELSGGEHQKIALARALLQNRSMIILDEPTSNLDAYAETTILKNFLSYNNNKSVIIVTHRLAAVHLVDKIIVLENAQIVEQGTHDELIKNNGIYAHMYELQSKEYK